MDFTSKVMNNLGFGGPAPASEFDDYPDPYPWLEGTRIYHKFGKVVVKCNTTDGVVTRKVGHKRGSLRTEAFMGNYAREVAGMKVPAFRGLKTHEGHTIMTTDFDPGQPLDGVWNKLTYENQASIKQELKQQIQLMRQCKTNRLGCVNQHGELDPKIPVPDPYNRCIVTARLKPCADEATFDANKMKMVKDRGSKKIALGLVNKLQPMMQELQKTTPIDSCLPMAIFLHAISSSKIQTRTTRRTADRTISYPALSIGSSVDSSPNTWNTPSKRHNPATGGGVISCAACLKRWILAAQRPELRLRRWFAIGFDRVCGNWDGCLL